MPDIKARDVSNDQDWLDLAVHWRLRTDTTYLNHGSFGLPPDAVRHARRQWIDRLDEQPMDFYLRKMEPLLLEAKNQVAKFVGTTSENLIFVDNATYGMNVVAHSFDLNSGDEVLINDHEYGSVKRIWQRKCDRVGAKLACVEMPERFESPEQIADVLLSGITDKTKLLIVSHITSPTALIMPVREICEAFRCAKSRPALMALMRQLNSI